MARAEEARERMLQANETARQTEARQFRASQERWKAKHLTYKPFPGSAGKPSDFKEWERKDGRVTRQDSNPVTGAQKARARMLARMNGG